MYDIVITEFIDQPAVDVAVEHVERGGDVAALAHVQGCLELGDDLQGTRDPRAFGDRVALDDGVARAVHEAQRAVVEHDHQFEGGARLHLRLTIRLRRPCERCLHVRDAPRKA